MTKTTRPPIDLNEPAVMRSVLAHLLRQSDLAGFDRRGRTILQIQISMPLWLLEERLVFGAEAEDLEDDERTVNDTPVELWTVQQDIQGKMVAR